MLPHALSRNSRRLLRWSAWTLATLTLIVALGFLYVTFIGIAIDASLLRGTIAQTFSNTIGRQVRFEGPMQIELSARPKLRVGGLHIANAQGFGAGDFASLGEARLALDLWPLLLERKLHIEELAGSDVRIDLQARADSSNNWTFHSATAPAKQTPVPGAASSMRADQALTLLDVQRVLLENVKVTYTGASGRSHYFSLNTLTAQSPAGQPLKLSLNGAVENEFPYRLDFTGGKLDDLATGKPWPVAFTLTFLSSTLVVNGNVNGSSGQVTFGLGTENLREFERLLQTHLPDVGASGIAGTVGFAPHHVTLTQLSGVMGNTTLIGALDFGDEGARPRLSGTLELPSLDLRPFLADKPATQTAQPPRNLAEVYRSLSMATFDLGQMNGIDLDLTLGIRRWLSLPGDVHDVTLQLKLDNAILHAPVRAVIAGVVLTGSAQADATTSPPRFRLDLGTRDSDLGGLAELLAGVPGIKGHLGRFDFRLASQGNQGSELVRGLDVQLDIERGRFSYGNIDGGRPVAFGLDRMSVRLPPGKTLRADLRGTLLDHAFAANLQAGALEPMMSGTSSPMNFSLRSGGVNARVHGTLQVPAGEAGPDLLMELSAPRAGELASWFGFTPGAEAPASLTGAIALRSAEWRLNNVLFRLGRSSIRADVARVAIGTQPLLKVKLAADQIDVRELESMLPRPAPKATVPEGPVLDIPILPRGIDLTDADIEVRVHRFAGSPLEVSDMSFDGRVREGYMYPSPFSVNVAATQFGGAVTLDLRGSEPSAGLWLFASNLDVGALLRKLGVDTNLDATFREFAVNLVARSSRLGDMLAKSELLGQIGGGRITLRDRNTGAEARIGLDKGELRADPGAPLKLNLWGSFDQNPVTIALETARADELVNPKTSLPLRMDAQAAGTRISLTGTLARPIGSQIELALQVQGTRFDALNSIVRAALPPWGPWTAQGSFLMSPRGYEVNDLRLRVADSVLTGQGSLVTDRSRPRLDLALFAPTIQLDNFKFGDWSPVAKKTDDKSAKSPSADELRDRAAQASNQAQQLLSPEVLRRQDAYLKVQVDQVLSGADKLGGGRLEAKLENGRADIGPVVVDVPGGSARLHLGYQPTEQDVKVDLRIDVDQFDYGVLARRIKPDSDLSGTFSLRMDVESRARYLSDILRHGSGRIEFAVWPQNMRSGVFDLWAVNVLVALVPAVDPDNASKVNCAVGRFDLNDGQLVDRSIVMDTSKMRVTGKGQADFAREHFDLRMSPQAKTAQFLSLATPIQVSGAFDTFKIGVSPGDILGTIGRLGTSILWVPLQKLFGKKIPADGRDVCFPVFGDSTPSAPASG
jgi:uncharacterized protein involved in outer membrane biogenesis